MIIGVTGGAGSGKSTVVRMWENMGARIIDVDHLAREAVEQDAQCLKQIRDAFGKAYFDKSGRLKRRELGQHVFSDPLKLQRLNQIVWPVMLHRLRQTLHAFEKGEMPVVVDMAVLFEAGAGDLFDCIVVVDAPREERVFRLVQSRGWTREEAENRIDRQGDWEAKKRMADRVMDNSGDFDDLGRKSKSLFMELIREGC